MGRSLDVDPDGVRGAGSVVRQAPTQGTPSPAVTPAAVDATSVGVATELGALMATLGINTNLTNAQTEAASTRLTRSADTYQEQDVVSSEALGTTHGGAAPVQFADVQTRTFTAPQVPAMPPVPAGGGIVPVTGHEIATVAHGGPGPQGLDDAAAALNALAGGLDQAAATVRSGRGQASSSWSSDAADNADTHLTGLQRRYEDHAEQARTGASKARAQAANFRQFQASTPEPSVFTDLERRLHAASVANAQPGSMGRYSAIISELQTKLAEANSKAITAFSQYTTAAQSDSVGGMGQPATPTAGGPTNPAAGPADESGVDTNTSAALDDPAADPLMDGATDTASQMLQTVLPAVLGAISGAVGGGVAAVSSAGQKLQEVGNQAVGGLTQGVNAALTLAASASAPKLGGNDGSSDGSGLSDFGSSGGGGGMPGDTEPASSTLDGPLSPPAVTAATTAPTVAAPATISASTPSTGGTSMTGMGGGMVPPMMGAPMGGRGGGSEEDKRLSPDRRLHIEEAPNAEPVKGRREARATRRSGDTEN